MIPFRPALPAACVLATLLAACQAPVAPGPTAAPGASPTVTPSDPAPMASPSASPIPAVIAVAPEPAAIAAAGGFVYVGSAATGTIQAIEPLTRAIVKEIPAPGGSVAFLAPSADGEHLFALDGKSGTLRVLDPQAGHAVVQAVTLGGTPSFAVVSPDDPTVMVALAGEPKAVLLTFAADDLAKAPTRRDFAVGGVGAGGRTLGYDHGWVVVPNPADGTASLFGLAGDPTKTLRATGLVGDAHMGVWGGVARQAIVASGDDGIDLFAVPSGERTRIGGLGRGPADLQGEENLRRIFVAMRGSDELAVVDYDKKRRFGSVATGKAPSTIAIIQALPAPAAYALRHEEDDDPREVWVGNEGDGTMTVVDASTLLVKATVPVGAGPHRVAFVGGRAFVANRGDGTVTPVDRRALR